MADLMQQAREQFEAWATSYGYCFTRLAPYDYHDGEGRAAWAAWQAALRAAPDGFVLVPVQTLESIRDSSTDPVARGFAKGALAARPQGVKDAG